MASSWEKIARQALEERDQVMQLLQTERAQNARYRAALEHYADESHWAWSPTGYRDLYEGETPAGLWEPTGYSVAQRALAPKEADRG